MTIWCRNNLWQLFSPEHVLAHTEIHGGAKRVTNSLLQSWDRKARFGEGFARVHTLFVLWVGLVSQQSAWGQSSGWVIWVLAVPSLVHKISPVLWEGSVEALDSHSPKHRIRSGGKRNLGCAQNWANSWKIVQHLLKRERANLQLPEYLLPLLFPLCFTASINPALYKKGTFLKVNFRAVTSPYGYSHLVEESGSGGKRWVACCWRVSLNYCLVHLGKNGGFSALPLSGTRVSHSLQVEERRAGVFISLMGPWWIVQSS